MVDLLLDPYAFVNDDHQPATDSSSLLEICKPIWNIILMVTFMSSCDVHNILPMVIVCNFRYNTRVYMCDTWNVIIVSYIL